MVDTRLWSGTRNFPVNVPGDGARVLKPRRPRMLKKTIIAGFALLIAAFAFQPVDSADAKVRIHIGIGDPYYGGPYYGDPYYNPDPYYRGYEPRYRPVPRYRPRLRPGRISCRQARRIVRRNGFRNIRVVDCTGKQYNFRATKRGHWYRMRMRSNSGRIYHIRRM